jgi:hypothetical protein
MDAMTGRAHPQVDAYRAQLPEWQRVVCGTLREVIWEADPDIEETIKRTVQPYFVLSGNVCALLSTQDHVNLFLYDPTVSDPHGLINRTALVEILREIVANNRRGGWRRLSRQP